METSLHAFAAANGHFFTRANALDLGVGDRQLRQLHRDDTILRIRHGAYAFTDDFRSRTPTQKHLVLARAVLAQQDGHAVLTGPSAAVAHGLDVYGHDLRIVHLARLDRSSSRGQAGVRHHRFRGDISPEVVQVGGVAALNPARAVWEIARTSSLESGVVTADSAFRLLPGLRPALEELADRSVRHPGSHCGRQVIRLADGRAESGGESVTRVQFYRYGVPMPTLQFELHDCNGVWLARHDFCWEGHRHLGEFDGKIKYGELLRPGETPADALFREKKREDLSRGERYGMTRFVWEGIMPRNAERTMAGVLSQLEQSRRLYII